MFKFRFGRKEAPRPVPAPAERARPVEVREERRPLSPEGQKEFARKKLELMNQLKAAENDLAQFLIGKRPKADRASIEQVIAAIKSSIAALEQWAAGTEAATAAHGDPEFLRERGGVEFAEGQAVKWKGESGWKVKGLTPKGDLVDIARMRNGRFEQQLARASELLADPGAEQWFKAGDTVTLGGKEEEWEVLTVPENDPNIIEIGQRAWDPKKGRATKIVRAGELRRV